MEFADSAQTAIGNPADVVDRAVVPRRHLVGIFDDFINEITEVENETELIGGRRALILKDHPAIPFSLPSLTLWQLTKAKLTGRGSFASGAVIVRPTRLPFPSPSVKRYQ